MSKEMKAFILALVVLISTVVMACIDVISSQVAMPIITGIGMGAIAYLFPSQSQ
jgi:hypothetical protein